MKYEFYNLPAQMSSSYPSTVRAMLSTAHGNVVSQFISAGKSDAASKKKVVHILNCISYMFLSGDSISPSWSIDDPMSTYKDIDEDILETFLSKYNLYISSSKEVDWKSAVSEMKVDESHESIAIDNFSRSKSSLEATVTTQESITNPTDKSDLYIQSPTVPQFDSKSVWASGFVDGTQYCIYSSLPKVPTKQNEISVTTDVNIMTDSELRKLFPNKLIRTRATSMYEGQTNLRLDPILGVILPIEGYTEDELVDNLIKYPHLFRLTREIDGELKSFYNSIEIDGELYNITDVWKDLPESKYIPYSKDFLKEYVVRRYLLERDIKGIQHRYSMYGSLDPYLTLFTSIQDYINMGRKDILDIARQCVQARVNYKRTRNPILRRIDND